MFNQIIHYHQSTVGLVEGVADFFTQSINSSIPCVAFMNYEHKTMLESRMANKGIDLESAYQFGQLIILDSPETLSYIVSEQKEIRPELFHQVIGGVIATALKDSERISVYHELDSELEQYSPIDAVMINKLWRDLGKYRKFNLFRSYFLAKPLAAEPKNNNRLISQPNFA